MGNQKSNQSDLEYLASHLSQSDGRIPEGKRGVAYLAGTPEGVLYHVRQREKRNEGMAGLTKLLNFAVSPQGKPFEPDKDLLEMYRIKACCTRKNYKAAIDAVFKELEARCNANDRSLFCYGGKAGNAMSNSEILKSDPRKGTNGWDLTEKGETFVRDVLSCLSSQDVIMPKRPPVKKFHSKTDLQKATKNPLSKYSDEKAW
jgi:hypothetical protein